MLVENGRVKGLIELVGRCETCLGGGLIAPLGVKGFAAGDPVPRWAAICVRFYVVPSGGARVCGVRRCF